MGGWTRTVFTEWCSIFANQIKEHPFLFLYATKSPVISPNFLVWKFCGKEQFLHSFGWITRNYVKTVPFHKVSTPGNLVKLRYFSQCYGGHLINISLPVSQLDNYEPRIIIKFPLHLTDTIQPLRVACFGTLKGMWDRKVLRLWTLESRSKLNKFFY